MGNYGHILFFLSLYTNTNVRITLVRQLIVAI